MVNTTLLELYLGHNRTGCTGASSLARSLVKNTTLSALGLGSNKIGDRGAKAIADVVSEHNRSMTKLELQSNCIGQEGMIALANAMLSNWTLTSFTAMDNLEDQECYQQLPRRNIFRSPPMARTAHKSMIPAQLSVNNDPQLCSTKADETLERRNRLRHGWLMHQRRPNPGGDSNEAELWRRLCDMPEDAFRLVVRHAVPVPQRLRPQL